MKLRGYQRRAVAAIQSRLAEHGRVVGVSPTGSGKTVIGAALIRETPGRVLWLAHRVELLDQARAELIAAGLSERDVGIYSGTRTENEDARVLVASIDKIRCNEAPPADFVVVDEAHRVLAASYREALAALPDAQVLGLTATPWRLDGRGLGDVFTDMLVIATPTALIADGFIAEPVCYGIPQDKAMEMVRGVGSSRGDYAQGALGRAMLNKTLMGNIIDECERLAHGKLTLVFAASREHGRALVPRFRGAGRRVAYLDGETPKGKRDEIVSRMRHGGVDVVVNVDVLSEGFDCPPVQCVALARPTKSLTRFLQHCGRGSRPFGDERPIILDHAGNCWRHGLPHAERDWSLDDRPRGSGGEPPVRMCGECGALNPIAASTCAECGADLPLTETERSEREAELERLKWEAAELARVEGVLRELAAERGEDEAWVRRLVEARREGLSA